MACCCCQRFLSIIFVLQMEEKENQSETQAEAIQKLELEKLVSDQYNFMISMIQIVLYARV